MPQGLVTRVAVGWHVVMHWNKLMPHVVNRVHSILKEIKITIIIIIIIRGVVSISWTSFYWSDVLKWINQSRRSEAVDLYL